MDDVNASGACGREKIRDADLLELTWLDEADEGADLWRERESWISRIASRARRFPPITFQAKRRYVQIKANDYVEILGERVKLNC